jgi:BCD family chlorophyll transporter-like MFS transporter
MIPSRLSPVKLWTRIGPQWLPFADAASQDLPLGRLLRLSMFQCSVGMVLVLTNGTLNRVMIVELAVPASLVAFMISLPLLFAPLRALIGHRSDYHRSALGWRRVPFIWYGTLLQFGGLAIMPFALLVLTGQGNGPAWAGQLGAGLAFLLIGAGMHTTQTAGLALATDIAPDHTRPRVVALLYVMLLLGMIGSALLFGWLLADFSPTRLVQVVQFAAVLAVLLNLISLWKQEARNPARTARSLRAPNFLSAWREFVARREARRLLICVALGSAAFSMQDILLEPFGGEILNMSVSQTTALTGLLGLGTLLSLAIAARVLNTSLVPARLAAIGLLIGIVAFTLIVCAGAFMWPVMFQIGTFFIGMGVGFFSVSMLIEAMRLADKSGNGVALGAWGAVNATAAGVAVAVGGLLRDLVSSLAEQGHLGAALSSANAGYSVVYHLEIALLFVCLVALSPLVRYKRKTVHQPGNLQIAQFPN